MDDDSKPLGSKVRGVVNEEKRIAIEDSGRTPIERMMGVK